MKNLILILLLFILTSCTNQKKILSELFYELNNSPDIDYKIELVKTNSDLIFLKNNKLKYDSLAGIQFKDANFFIDNRDKKLMSIEEIILGKKLSSVSFTIGTYSNIVVYYKKINNKWYISNSILLDKIKLKNSRAVMLCKKIDSINNVGKEIKYDIPLEEMKKMGIE